MRVARSRSGALVEIAFAILIVTGVAKCVTTPEPLAEQQLDNEHLHCSRPRYDEDGRRYRVCYFTEDEHDYFDE